MKRKITIWVEDGDEFGNEEMYVRIKGVYPDALSAEAGLRKLIEDVDNHDCHMVPTTGEGHCNHPSHLI